MAIAVNTRRYKRYAAKLRVKLFSGGLSFWAITSDISENGLRIRVNQEFPVNKALDLELIMPDGHVSFIRGLVRYVNETPHSEKRFGAGIEIIEDDRTFKDYLKDLEAIPVMNNDQTLKVANIIQYRKENITENKACFVSPSISEKPLDCSIAEDIQETKEDGHREIALQESNIIQSSNQTADKSCEPIGVGEKEKEFIGCPSVTNENAKPSESKWHNAIYKKIKLSHIFIIVFLAIGIVTSIIFFYENPQKDVTIQRVSNLYFIQVGAFQIEANAQILAQRYKEEKGQDVFIDKSTIKDKGIMYKVLIGPFKTLEDTSHLAQDIREKENIDAFVICK